MKSSSIILIFTSLIILSCGQTDPNKQIDEGNVKGEIYESREIGWSLEIPKGWTVISRDKLEANDQKGKDAIEKVYEGEINTKDLKHLISFQKDAYNIFASTSQPFKEEFPGQYAQNNKGLYKLIYDTFISQGIETDSLSGKEIIQGQEFSTFYTTIYAPDGTVILKQIIYSKLVNGFDFSVNINYNNEQDKKIMMDAWSHSKFTGSPNQ